MNISKNFYSYRIDNNNSYKVQHEAKLLYLFSNKMFGKVKIPGQVKIMLDVDSSRMFFILLNKEKETFMAFQKFVSNLRLCEQAFKNPYKAKVFLKGVGFRINTSGDGFRKLSFSLGYSHKINVLVPSGVFLVFSGSSKDSATSVVFSSRQKNSLITFVSSLKKYRKPEYYTGKGLLVINQKNLIRYKLLQKVR